MSQQIVPSKDVRVAGVLQAANFAYGVNPLAEGGVLISGNSATGAGTSVVVYPEGTRGRSYALRPFKKGPFVLAIAAQVPIVPVVIHGTREVQGKGDLAVHGGTCEVTFLAPIPTTGMTYDDRDRLMQTVWQHMAAELAARYGIQSTGSAIDTQTTAA